MHSSTATSICGVLSTMYRRTISASCLLYPASRMTRSHSLCSKPDKSSGMLTLALANSVPPSGRARQTAYL
nr:MAG TPA: hypothetical protein [Caudoviricetes sp.]